MGAMNLPEYIRQIGDEAASRLFCVSERRVRSWRYGARLPKPATALEIERITGGRVTVAEIYSAQSEKRAA